MIHLVSLTPASLPRLLWLGFVGTPPVVATVRPVIRQLARPLNWIVDRLAAAGRARRAEDLCPWLNDHPRYEGITDVYLRLLPVATGHYGLADLDKVVPDYAQAARFSLFDGACQWDRMIVIARRLCREGQNVRLHGVDEFVAAALKGEPWAESLSFTFLPGRSLRRLGTFCLASLVAGVAAAFATRRLRLHQPRSVEVFLGASGRLPHRDGTIERVLADIVDSPEQVRIVFESAKEFQQYRSPPGLFQAIRLVDGLCSPGEWLDLVRLAVSDLARLWWHFGAVPLVEFRMLASLPYKRVVYRSLLNRVRFRYFLGRDDYAVDHIVRRMEMNRVGGFSLGLNHGLPVTTILEPGWTFLSFDYYYVFGVHLHRRYCSATWARDMVVRATGTFGRSRERLRWAASQTRSRNIVFYAAPGPFEMAQADLVAEVAAAFPDRRVLVKIKSSRRKEGWCPATFALFGRQPNIVETTEDTYQLMATEGYALSGYSTVAAEAVQFGLITYVLDVAPSEFPNYFRDFPDLCVSSAKEVIERIRAIEAGTLEYHREIFADLVDLSGRTPYDVVRADMGLPPRDM